MALAYSLIGAVFIVTSAALKNDALMISGSIFHAAAGIIIAIERIKR